MKVGKQIKKFRLARGMSQKELAIRVGVSEPAIRNYELGKRFPNERQIERIAGVLGVSPYAIANPDFDETYYGVTHALFRLEDIYGLRPIEEGIHVSLDFGANRSMCNTLRLWYEEREKLRRGEITQEEYDLWRYSFPRLEAERVSARIHEMREQERLK